MSNLNPPPNKIPKSILKNSNIGEFFTTLLKSLYQVWYGVGGQTGVPTILKTVDTPTVDPGWATSSTVDMNPPSGYVRILVNGDEKVIPFFDT